jgi:predicted amidophosphoribosyltransferase
LKHGDRSDFVKPAAMWMTRSGADLFGETSLIVPVPLHRTRLVRRMFNQSADLARVIAGVADIGIAPDALVRTRPTRVQEGMSVEERFANTRGAISVRRGRADLIRGRSICLIDDVMTSGATLTSAATACLDAGAHRVDVLVLARVIKDT